MAEKTIRVRIDNTGAVKNLNDVNKQLKNAGSQASLLNENIRNARGGFGQFNSVMQQAGYQVQDFFVQVQGGQSVLTAFSQQGSQLAGVFGPQGAVIGALIAVGAVLAGVFTSSSETAKKSVDDLIDSFDDLGKSQRELLKIKLADAMQDLLDPANEAYAKVLNLNQEIEKQKRIIKDIDAGTSQGWLSGLLLNSDDANKKLAELQKELIGASAEQEELDSKYKKYKETLDQINNGELEHKDSLDNLKKTYKEMTDSYELQIAAMGKTEREQAKLVAAHQLGQYASDKQVEKINKLIDKYFDEKDAISESVRAEKEAEIQHENEAKARERQIEALGKWYDNIQTYNMSASELNDQWRDNELTKLDAYHEAGKLSQEEYEESLYQITEKWLTKGAALEGKNNKNKTKQTKENVKDLQTALSAGQEALNALYNATEGRSNAMNAIVKGAAVFQATANMWLAASQALALPGDVSLPQKLASYAAVVSAGAGIISSLNNLSPSRQVGGYMNANTPYQVGGGAHTDDPEMYTSGGKSYLIDSSAGKMTRVDKSGGSSAYGNGSVQVLVNNNGQAADVTQTNSYVDEDGVRKIVLELTPQIMSSEAGNANSPFRTTMSSNSKTQWDYS